LTPGIIRLTPQGTKASNRPVSALSAEAGAPTDSPNTPVPVIVRLGGDVGATVSPARPGYQMIESTDIINFRAFERVKLEGFKRINLIVGDNGAGKTSFLEALFMASANNAEVAMRLRTWRGMDVVQSSPREFYQSVYASLFRNFDSKNIGSIKLTGTHADNRSIRFFYDDEAPTQLPLESIGTSRSSVVAPVVFEYTDVDGKTERSVVTIQPTGLSAKAALGRGADSSFLAARAPFVTSENASWFSELSKTGNADKLIKSMQEQFPFIEGLSIEIESGQAMIFLKSRYLTQKIATGLASDGLNKLLTVLLHIAHAKQSATFIDELENGLHFSRHEKMWPQLLDSVERFDSQIFASTHSFEFIRSIVPTLKKNLSKFALIRVFQDEGKSNATLLNGKKALDLIEAGLEIRT
jgi:AAA15 family ATPase/GTPase